MSQYNTNEFKAGLKILLDGVPCVIVTNEFVKPGKGQAFSRVKLRNLITGRQLERTFKSGETFPAANVREIEMTYLYNDGSEWHFMNEENYEQIAIAKENMKEAYPWLKEQDHCTIVLWNEAPLTVTAPTFVELTVTESAEGVRGDTVSGGSKSVQLETGTEIRVPLFVNKGDIVKIDTRTGEYVGRIRD